MKIFGITGSIGMGKSTTARLLRRMGVVTHFSDDAVHDLLLPKGKAYHLVLKFFPDALNVKTGRIDRKILGQIVFKSPEKRMVLEKILHPLVQWSQGEFIKKARRMGLKKVALDIPLLYETGAQRRVDRVLVATAPKFVQRLRVLARAGYDDRKLDAILKTQIPDHVKRKMADDVLPTGLGQADTYRRLKIFLRKN